MTVSDMAAMINEFNKGSDFADFVKKNAETYGTDAVAELHKPITFEYYKMVVGANKGKSNEKENSETINYVSYDCVNCEDGSC